MAMEKSMTDSTETTAAASPQENESDRLLSVASLMEATILAIEAGNRYRQMHDIIHGTGHIIRQVVCERYTEHGDPAETVAMRVFELADHMDTTVAGAIADGGDVRPLRAAARALLECVGAGADKIGQ